MAARVRLLRIFFFFSSRRRHTRCLSDWSSDVCSSDLAAVGCGAGPVARVPLRGVSRRLGRAARSEERRVGKECRSRWSPDQSKKSKIALWLGIDEPEFKALNKLLIVRTEEHRPHNAEK